MIVKCMLDKKTFCNKPNGYETAGIQKRLSQSEIEIEELANLLSNGATFKPALLNGTKSKDWLSQQLFALDFDEGTTIQNELQRCNQLEVYPVFGYTSFSYAEEKHKFRLVFCSKDIVSDINVRNDIQNLLIHLFPTSDSVTFDPTRLFYGGKNLIKCNYENRIDVNEMMIKYEDILRGMKSVNLSLSNTDNKVSSFISIHKPQNPVIPRDSDVYIQAIKNLDVLTMKNLLSVGSDKLICSTKQEVYDRINEIDMNEFVGIYGTVNCILPEHQDHSPSAHIYITDSGTQIYKCFGCNSKYTIISLVEKLAKCKRIKAIEFIKEIFNIELRQSEWQKEQLEILDTNIELLLSDEFKEVYPELHSLIRTRKANIIALNNYVKMNLKDEDFSLDDNPLFFVSLTNLMNIFGNKDKTKVSQSITLFSLLSLLEKVPHDKLPEDLLRTAKHIAAKYGHKKLTNFYVIGSYGVNSLEESNKIATLLKDHNISLKGLSREYILRTFGIEIANKIYPQYQYENELGTTKKSDDNTIKLTKYILETIDSCGYILEKDLKLDNGTETQWRRSIQEILDNYGLVKVTANKDMKEKYNIDVPPRSYPKIIIRKD